MLRWPLTPGGHTHLLQVDSSLSHREQGVRAEVWRLEHLQRDTSRDNAAVRASNNFLVHESEDSAARSGRVTPGFNKLVQTGRRRSAVRAAPVPDHIKLLTNKTKRTSDEVSLHTDAWTASSHTHTHTHTHSHTHTHTHTHTEIKLWWLTAGQAAISCCSCVYLQQDRRDSHAAALKPSLTSLHTNSLCCTWTGHDITRPGDEVHRLITSVHLVPEPQERERNVVSHLLNY